MSTAEAYADHGIPLAAEARDAVGAGIVRSASGATLRMAGGRSVTDFFTGGFGHGHPAVNAQVERQIDRLSLSTRMFLSRPLGELAGLMAEFTPGDLAVTFPCNSATEAMEGALKLARGYHPSRPFVVATVDASHGNTLGSLSVCGIEKRRGIFAELPVAARFVPYGAAEAMAGAIDERVAAVVIEPIATGNGVRTPPPGYLRELRLRCRRSGALLIVDESVTGPGVTGDRFGIDAAGIVPDVLVLGQTMGGGTIPAAAYVTTRKINDRVYGYRNPALHASTTGGNPLACAAGIAVLRALIDEELILRCRHNSEKLVHALRRLHERHPELIRRHSGRGYVQGLRLRDEQLARRVRRRALDQGLLLRHDGVPGERTWIGIRPPLTASQDELESAIATLESTMGDVADR